MYYYLFLFISIYLLEQYIISECKFRELDIPTIETSQVGLEVIIDFNIYVRNELKDKTQFINDLNDYLVDITNNEDDYDEVIKVLICISIIFLQYIKEELRLYGLTIIDKLQTCNPQFNIFYFTYKPHLENYKSVNSCSDFTYYDVYNEKMEKTMKNIYHNWNGLEESDKKEIIERRGKRLRLKTINICNGKSYNSIKERNVEEEFSFYLKEKEFPSYKLEENDKFSEECEILKLKNREGMIEKKEYDKNDIAKNNIENKEAKKRSDNGKKGEKKEEESRNSIYIIIIIIIYRS